MKCHSDYMEIVVKADLFKLGILIDMDDLELNRTKRPAGLQHQLPEMNTEYLQRYQTVEPTVW